MLLFLIVFACTLFTNGIEWLGHRFHLSEGAVGSVLAAVGTALPETLVPIIAIVSGLMNQGAMKQGALSASEGEAIGIGAILGAPFLLSTLALFVTGFAVFYFARCGKRTRTMTLNTALIKRDFRYFFLAFGLSVLAGVVPLPAILKYVLAGALLLLYAWYVYKTVSQGGASDGGEALEEPLMFHPKAAHPHTGLIVFQSLVGLLGIVLLAHQFVEQISHISSALGVNPLILSLIIVPIATELPEKFNSVVWIGKQKDSLALGNITGAMVFQSCIPSAVGLALTSWQLNLQAMVSVVLCLVSSAVMYLWAFRGTQQHTASVFMLGGVFYLLFVVYALWILQQSVPM
ncbi:MAG: sodium:calcium antiporter [Candidatus Melainabacteria bacterium]|nr:sodium:calcium antiporter [Candidatus Melainabacteria bacterium]